MSLPKGFRKVKREVLLKNLNTFKIGGKARFFSCPRDCEELKLLITAARKNKVPVFILGAGSNILISDKGVKGLVIKLDNPYFTKICAKGLRICAGSGVLLTQLINFAAKKGISGLESLSGIPGTVGGALMMNAGAWGEELGESVVKITVMDYNGDITTLKKEDTRFRYRASGLEKFIILSAVFNLRKEKSEKIKDRIREILNQRKGTQDTCLPNAGCVFKNPEGESAGRLIDLCGLKGKELGQVRISSKHANFILNKGRATSQDILKLMQLIKKQVKRKFNIVLEPTINNNARKIIKRTTISLTGNFILFFFIGQFYQF